MPSIEHLLFTLVPYGGQSVSVAQSPSRVALASHEAGCSTPFGATCMRMRGRDLQRGGGGGGEGRGERRRGDIEDEETSKTSSAISKTCVGGWCPAFRELLWLRNGPQCCAMQCVLYMARLSQATKTTIRSRPYRPPLRKDWQNGISV